MLLKRKNSTVVTFLLCLVLGLLFTLIGSLILSDNTNLKNNGIKTEAVVVNLIQINSSKSTTYKPEIEYTIETGEVLRIISDSSSNPPAYKVGEKVNIYYLKDNPYKFIIDSFFEIYMFPLIFIIAGSILLLIDLVMIIKIIVVLCVIGFEKHKKTQ